nr:uncharacterized protein LOC111099474 [Crassostrea virginica]
MDDGVSKVAEMKRHLHSYSKNELGITKKTRRFFPSDKDIRNIMGSHKDQTQFSKDDKENLKQMIDDFSNANENDKFHLEISENEEFLFVAQTESQKRLLNIYGQEICLLDATYNTTQYNLPAFFVCVNTNVGYSTVGCFITADEKKESIMKGLHYLKEWNENWHPEFFMTDFDTSEISAIEETFPAKLWVSCLSL